MYLIHYDLQQSNKNPHFNKLMFDPGDTDFFKSLIDTYGDRIYLFYRYCKDVSQIKTRKKNKLCIRDVNQLSITIECGQKIMPLKISA